MVNDNVIKNFMDEYICIDPKKSYKIEDLISVMIGLNLGFGLDELKNYLTKKEYYFKVEKYEIYGIYSIDEYDSESSSNTEDKSNFKKIIGTHCVATGCKKGASFNMLERKKRRYCSRHKIDEMVNVAEKRQCKEEGCTKKPCFNFPGEKKGERCESHQLSGMIDVIHCKCDEDRCTTRPCFNFPGKKNGARCESHQLPGMIDVMHNQCDEKECTTRPCFNFPGKKNGARCGLHKLPGMINVESPQCDEEGFTTQPSFNFPGKKNGIRCNTHKLDDMVNVVAIQCEKENCTTQSCFNFPGEKKGARCGSHRLDGMIDVINKKCISCNYTTASPNYGNYCMRCYIHTYPDNIISRKFKTKERMIVDFIRENYSGEIYFDEIVRGECSSKRRPDIRIDRGVFNLIIEVDENQHRNYDPICENKRTMQLFKDLDSRPLVLIRINPDSYYDKNDKKIDSCFDYKFLEMPFKNKEEFDRRMIVLKEKIDYYMNYNDVPEKEITNISLFFDGY
jgi:hypothetical protein